MLFKLNSNILVLVTIALGSVSPQAVNYTLFAEEIEKLATNDGFLIGYERHVAELLKIEPDYFHYTPFKNLSYRFDCQVDEPTEPATSVHRLRPRDIKVTVTEPENSMCCERTAVKGCGGVG